MTLEELRVQALTLDLTSRAALARDLLQSLDQPSEQEILGLALDEAQRRQAEVRSGRVRMLPGDEVMDRQASGTARNVVPPRTKVKG